MQTLDQMIPAYHDVCGNGLTMELAFSIDRDGLVQETHAKVYKQLGDWVRGCYGKPLAAIGGAGVAGEGSSTVFSVEVPTGSVFDRFQMIEDTRHGQRVHNWTISAQDDQRTTVLATGQAIGIKRITLLGPSSHYHDLGSFSSLHPIFERHSLRVQTISADAHWRPTATPAPAARMF